MRLRVKWGTPVYQRVRSMVKLWIVPTFGAKPLCVRVFGGTRYDVAGAFWWWCYGAGSDRVSGHSALDQGYGARLR